MAPQLGGRGGGRGWANLSPPPALRGMLKRRINRASVEEGFPLPCLPPSPRRSPSQLGICKPRNGFFSRTVSATLVKAAAGSAGLGFLRAGTAGAAGPAGLGRRGKGTAAAMRQRLPARVALGQSEEREMGRVSPRNSAQGPLLLLKSAASGGFAPKAAESRGSNLWDSPAG